MLDWLKATGRIFALFLGVFALAAAAQAGPEDGRIVNGSGSISQSGTHTDIRQNSDFLATHWGSFNIAAHESVQAHQPGASSRLLIRVDGGGATNIAGTFTANGITILENRNGVQFSRGAIVNVGGLLATSSRISGVGGAHWQLNGTGGAVVNHGQIAAGAGGVVLAAVRVENHGKITAQGGDVSLGAGSAFTVDFAGSLVGFEVKKAADGASVVHDGVIESQGGIVSLSAQEAQAVRTNVVSVGGVVKATRIERRGGVVYLSGGTQGIAEVSGDVSASKKVQTTGEYVVVKEGALLKAPEILVGGDFQGGGDVQTAQRTLVERGALLDASAKGRVIVWSDETTWFNGNITAPEGFAEVSGKQTLASVHLAGIDVGELLLDPADIIIAASGTGVAVTASIVADAGGGSMTLDVDSVNEFAGDLSLAATNTIMVDGEINKPTGDLTLIAGGVLTLGANITTSAGDLALTGASMALSGAATLTGAAITITAPTINIGADRALTITASGALTLATVGMITGTGTAELSLEGDTIAGLSTALTLNVPTVSLELTGADSAFTTTRPFLAASPITTLTITTAAAQDYRVWMRATNRNLTITSPGGIRLGATAINLGTGNLTLSGDSIAMTNAAGLTITAGDVTLSSDRGLINLPGVDVLAFVVMASGDIALSSSIQLPTARVELRADADGMDGGMITSTPGLFAAGSVFLQQAVAFDAASLFIGTIVPGAATFRITTEADQTIHPWMADLSGTDFSLRGVDGVTLASITLPETLTRTGDIDLQAAAIALTAATTTLTGGAISLTGAISETADTRNLTINASGILTLNSDITLPTGGSNGRLEITAFRVNLPSAIALAPSRLRVVFNDPAAVNFETSFDGAGVAGSTFPGIVSDIIRTIFTYAPRDCGGEAVCELTSMDNVDEIGQGFRLSPMLTANDSIMIRAERSDLIFSGTEAISITAPIVSIQARSINIGGRNFTITANGGTLTLAANITTTGDITLSSTGMNAGITLMFNIELAGRDISLTGAIDEPSGATNSFVATASGRLTLNDNINVGTNGLGLTGTGGITLANAAGLTLRGGAVRLTGVVTADNLPLTIEAQQGIVIDNDINLGVGRLELIAGLDDGAVAFVNVHTPDPDITITVGSFLWAQDMQFASGAMPPANFVLPDEVRIEGIYFGTDTSAVDPAWLDVRQFQAVRYMLGDGMGDVVVPQAATSALESITLNAAADSTISFGGTGAITLTAPQITITGEAIIIGEGRTLTINAEGGTLTLNVDAIELSGTATAGSVTLSAAAIVNNAALTLDVPTVNITQDGEFGPAAPFTFSEDVTTLNLSTQAAQAYRGWMTAPNPGPDRTVSLMSAGVITVGQSAIDLGAGGLTLNGTGGIRLANAAGLTITAAAVSLTGSLSSSGLPLSVVATGDIIVGGNINLGMGALDLRAGVGDTTGDIGNGGTARQIIAGSLHLQTDTNTELGVTLLTNTSRVAGAVAIRFGTVVSPRFPSLGGWLPSLGRGDLSIRGIDGVTLAFLTIGNPNRSEGVVDLRATTLSIDAIDARAITLHMDTINPPAAVSFTATDGDLTFRGADGTGSPTLDAGTTSLTLRQNGAFGATAPLTFGAEVTSLTLTTAAAQTVQGWMTTSGRSLSVTSGGVLTLNDDIVIVGAGDLTLTTTGTGGIMFNSAVITLGVGALVLSSNNISFTHADGLTLTAVGINLNGDVVSQNLPFTFDAQFATGFDSNINTGTGDITISSAGAILLATNTTLTGGNVTLTITGGGGLRGNNREFRVNAGGDITFDIANLIENMRRFDLRAGGNIINAGTARALTAGDVFLQADAFADNLFAATGNSVSGSVSLRLTTVVSQTIHPWMAGLGNGDFSLRGEGVVLDAITLATALTRSAGEVDLHATSIIFDGTGALTGTVINLRADNVFQQNTGALVAIHASTGEITATRITDTGAAATGVPVLGGTTSFSLEQTTAFGALDTLPFTFTAAEITAITISTRSDQFVQDWMIAEDRDLTITSSERVVVDAAIGSMAPNRNIGAGALSLTSTGAAVRIFADISTTRRLTLSGVIGGINFNNRAAKTLTGLSVTLRGAAVSNRALTITASSPSGFVTISGGINTGTSDLSLSTGSGGGIVLDSGDVELRGGVITLGGVVRGDNNSGLSVFANGNIILGGEIALGSGALTLSAGENGTGNISFVGGAVSRLTVGALTLRQVSAFGETLFASGSTASGAVSLRLRTAVDQPVHPWMTGLGTGSFSLRGVDGITLTSIITTTALNQSTGSVDLQATAISLGGNVTGRDGITLIADTITLTANIDLSSNASVSLTGAIDGSANNRDLSATAAVRLTLNSNINLGTGNLSLLGVGIFVLGGNITITSGEVVISNAIQSAAGVNPNFTVNASNSISIRSVNLGTGNLTLNNMGATDIAMSLAASWNARNITLTGAIDDSANNRNLTINASGVLTLNNDINLGERNLNINAMGGITLGGNVTLTSRVTILRGAVDGTNGNHNFTIMDSAGSNLHNDINLGSGTFTLANTGSGQVNFSIVGAVGAPLTIAAGNINFMRNNDVVWVLQAGVVAQGADLTLRATGDITFQGTVINLGPGRLEMSADNEGNGTGTIIAANTPQILVGSLVLRHAATFPADFMADTSAITGAVDLRITGAMVTQAIHPWMNLGGTSFTLRGDEGEGARAAVVLTAITIGETTLNYGTADIDLQADAITLSADVVLTGGAISLTGALTTATNNLTITASGLLTLNSGIDLGTGILTITADDRINVPTSGTRIRAMANNIIFTDRLVQSFEVGFTPAGSTTTTFNNMIFIPTATSMFAPSPCLIARCVLGTGAALTVDPLLEADESITINAGANALSFSGEGAITITSEAISITAGTINIGERSLTITAAGGTITLSVGMITGTGAASLSLDAATIAGLNTSRNPSAITVDVPNISISRDDEAFGTAPPVTFGTTLNSLTLTTARAQTVFLWMIDEGRSLSVTSGAVLTVNVTGGFTLGASADLTLNGIGSIVFRSNPPPPTIGLTARDITLSSEGNITFERDFTLTAENITLNGTFDGSANNRSFSATATGNLVFLDATINTGTNDITLTADVIGLREVSGNPDLVLTGRNVQLTAPQGLSGENRILEINANNNITVVGNNIFTLGRELRLHADADGDGNGVISRGSTAIFVRVPSLSLRQAGAFDANLFNDGSEVGGSVDLRITTAVGQDIHPWMAGLGLGNGDFSLHGATGVVLSRISLSASDIPLGFTRNGVIDLRATTILLGVPLTGTSVALRATSILGRDSQPVVIHATEGEITATRINATGGVSTSLPTDLRDTPSLTLTQSDAFGSAALFTFEAAVLTSLTLETGAALQPVQGWMITNGRDLNLTSTGGDITIGRNINVGTGNNLTLIASGNILAVTPRPRLVADTVRLELTGTSSFTSRPFLATSRITTLEIATVADQDYRVWMRATNRNLTIDTQGAITIGSTAINLGTGDLTLNADLGVLLTNTAGLTITAGDFTLFAGSLSLSRDGRIANVSQFVVNASGDITTTSISLAGARVELRADNGSIMTALSPDEGTLASIIADFLLMQQSVAFADGLIGRNASQINRLELRTTTAVDQPIHEWMRRVVANGAGIIKGFSLRGAGSAVLTSITTAAALDFGTATVDLQATTINLRGALTGGAVALRTNMLTGDSANRVAIHAMTGDITSTTITSTGGADEGRPALATDVTGFSLTRSRTFGGRGSLPFILTDLSAITAITLSTRSPQVVFSWMINPGRNLTITSASTVRVNAAIGSSVPGRNFGDGNLTLTSTGGLVRILFGISTNGNLTLIGGTDGINLNSGAGAKTIRGATVTLSGNARSNRALTLTATSGALTLSGGITGTRALELSGSGGIALGGALTLTGGAITLNSAVTGVANLTITTSGTLTLNNNINLTNVLTGAVLTLALSGAGAIGDGSSPAVLTASTVRLRQVDVFSGTQSPFNFGTTPSLELTTDAAQVVQDWMIASGRNLTVTSALNVVVRSAIVSGARNLGDGNITLVSTGGLVRIFAGISTTGNITLDGATGINLNSGVGAKTLRGEIVTLIGDARSNEDLTLNASTVRITQDAAFGETGPGTMLMFGTAPDSLELTTDAAQVVHDWMIADGRNLTVTSALNVIVRSAIVSGDRNLGDGSLTLVSTGGLVRIFAGISTTGNITLNGADGINFNNRTAKTLSGATVTLTGVVVSNRALTLTASGTLRFNNNITLNGGGALSLTSTGGDVRILGNITTGGDLTLNGGTGIDLRSGAAKTLSGAIVTLTGMVVSNRAVTLTASGTLTINNNIALTGTRALSLSGSGITLGSALTTLSGGAITLRGAATGTADLTITARGTLTINNDIGIGTNALTLTSGAGAISNGGAVRVLTASTVSLSQEAAFVGARPFNFDFGSTVGSLELTTTVNQDVFNWMIEPDTDLTVTSVGIVRVAAAIGGSGGRNLGNGNLTLESTGGAVRILANISTGGDLTLNGATGINLRGGVGGVRTFSGADITLTGAARSNRDLTITATGVLTINNNINIGTRALSLTASANPTFGTGAADLSAGDFTFSPDFSCTGSTTPTCTDTTP